MNKDNPQFRIRRFDPLESVPRFDCGDDDLNDFIANEAILYQKALLAVTYLIESEEGELAAYFSLANDRISLSDFESKTEFNRFRKHRFVNEKRLKSYPAVKLCRLAVASSYKGQHLGSKLLNYLMFFFTDNNRTGCRFITVDAYADAIPFYIKHNFTFLNKDDKNAQTRLLYYDLNDVL